MYKDIYRFCIRWKENKKQNVKINYQILYVEGTLAMIKQYVKCVVSFSGSDDYYFIFFVFFFCYRLSRLKLYRAIIYYILSRLQNNYTIVWSFWPRWNLSVYMYSGKTTNTPHNDSCVFLFPNELLLVFFFFLQV